MDFNKKKYGFFSLKEKLSWKHSIEFHLSNFVSKLDLAAPKINFVFLNWKGSHILGGHQPPLVLRIWNLKENSKKLQMHICAEHVVL